MSQHDIRSTGKHPRRECRVIAEYQKSNPDPIIMRKGDEVELTGKEDHWQGRPDWVYIWCTNQHGQSGWVPKPYIEQQGTKGTARFDYNATELTAHTGETLIAGQEESGWMWCANQHGQSGWVPIANIEC